MQTAAVLTLAAMAASVEGHAYLSNPLPRAQTIQGHQFAPDPQSDGTRYGECGDGGRIGPITATWTQGQEVTVEVRVTAFHGGYHELRFCEDPYGNNDCLRENLAIAVPPTRTFRGCPVAAPSQSADAGSCIPNAGCPSDNKDDCLMDLDGIGTYNYTFILPPDLVCDHCKMQWWWGTNNWAPEHFKSCHDVRILPAGPTSSPTAAAPTLPPPPTEPPTPAPPTPVPPTPPCSEFLFDVEFTGSDLAVLASVSSERECCESCNDNDQCVAFTYVPTGSGQWPTGCRLKSSMEQRSRSGVISGVKDDGGNPGPSPTSAPPSPTSAPPSPTSAPPPPAPGCGLTLMEDTEFEGGDIRVFETADEIACCTACEEDDNCGAFTFVPIDSPFGIGMRQCKLKGSASNQRERAKMVSGAK